MMRYRPRSAPSAVGKRSCGGWIGASKKRNLASEKFCLHLFSVLCRQRLGRDGVIGNGRLSAQTRAAHAGRRNRNDVGPHRNRQCAGVVALAMTFTVIECEQRSPEWRAARAGRLTGSRAEVLYMRGKKTGEVSKVREKYALQLIGERIHGESRETFFASADMQRGIALEPLAFAMYEADMGALVRRTGF